MSSSPDKSVEDMCQEIYSWSKLKENRWFDNGFIFAMLSRVRNSIKLTINQRASILYIYDRFIVKGAKVNKDKKYVQP